VTAQYFAQLDDNNIVVDVRVVSREFLEANPERYTGTWVETFFDTPGKQYAGVGFEYLDDVQAFRTQQPFPSWIWANNNWNPPTPMPNDGEQYRWSEEELEWVAI
jgi:hypothetical protein